MRFELKLIAANAFVSGLNLQAALHDTGFWQMGDLAFGCISGAWVVLLMRELLRELPA